MVLLLWPNFGPAIFTAIGLLHCFSVSSLALVHAMFYFTLYTGNKDFK